MVTEKMVNDVARRIYEDRHASMVNVWSWDDSGLDDEHPNARAEYEGYAKSAIAALSTDAEPVATMGDEDRTPMPTGFDAAQWRKADEVHHATALVANDTECVKIIYAALSPLASEPWQPRCSQGGRSHSLEEIFQDMSVAYDNGDNRISNILVWRAALSAQVQDVAGLSVWEGWDNSRDFWSETKHRDEVMYAMFRGPWSMEDAAMLLGFIDRTWPKSPAAKQGEAE